MKVQVDREEEIKQKYPKIFGSNQENTHRHFMFECNSGWFDLIDILCRKIQSRVDRLSLEQVVALQVKEKFGGLRFYCSGGDDVIDAYVEIAESFSYKICESCGAPGQQKTVRRWVHTSCDPCFEKLQQKFKENEEK